MKRNIHLTFLAHVAIARALLSCSGFLLFSMISYASYAADDCVEMYEHVKCQDALPFCEEICVKYSCGAAEMWFEVDLTGWDQGFSMEFVSSDAIVHHLVVPPMETGCAAQEAEVSGATLSTGLVIIPPGPGVYKIYIEMEYVSSCEGEFIVRQLQGPCGSDVCSTCYSPFMPAEGDRVMVTAWSRTEEAEPSAWTYDDDANDEGPEIAVTFPGDPTVFTFQPGGPIIDGWQRVEGVFEIPEGAAGMEMELRSRGDLAVIFDDVRVQPVDASMVSYVYDPTTLRLVAELDERHFATFYEYDAQGRLTRLKKETERGIMTLREDRRRSPGVTAE